MTSSLGELTGEILEKKRKRFFFVEAGDDNRKNGSLVIDC